jgi:flagellar basal-body rod modification protein FlgD
MTIQPVAAGGSAAAAAPARTPVQTMDSDVFMSLLVTQLKNQSPDSPMDTNQMMGQTIQLSMMEKLDQLAGNSKEGFSLQMRTAAAELIGRSVGYTLDDGTTGSGTATAVSFADGTPQVTIGDLNVPLDSVTGLTAPAAS